MRAANSVMTNGGRKAIWPLGRAPQRHAVRTMVLLKISCPVAAQPKQSGKPFSAITQTGTDVIS
jgi:hypothetical protein